VKKSMTLLITAAGLMAVSATASAFSTAPCKACHAIDHDVIGPAWQDDVKQYGSAEALAKVFKDGFKESDRKVLNSDPGKWKAKAAIMTPQFNSLIKGHEDEAAEAIFAAVKAGKM
jgi:cytochrome c551/c552